jgi:hypothetical protein
MKCYNADDLRDLILTSEIKPKKGKISNEEYQKLWSSSKDKSQAIWSDLLIKNEKFYIKDGYFDVEYLPEKNIYRRKLLPKGRPRGDNNKGNRVTVRLDDLLIKKLDEYCAAHGCDESEAIRIAISKL